MYVKSSGWHWLCLVITKYLEFGGPFGFIKSYVVVFLETTNYDEFLIRDVAYDFEEDIKLTIDELKEVNLGIEDGPYLTFISSLLNVKNPTTWSIYYFNLRICLHRAMENGLD